MIIPFSKDMPMVQISTHEDPKQVTDPSNPTTSKEKRSILGHHKCNLSLSLGGRIEGAIYLRYTVGNDIQEVPVRTPLDEYSPTISVNNIQTRICAQRYGNIFYLKLFLKALKTIPVSLQYPE